MNDHIEKREYDETQLANFRREFQAAKNHASVQAAFLIVQHIDGGKYKILTGGDPIPHNMLRMFITESNAYRRWTFSKLRDSVRFYVKRFLAGLMGIRLTEVGGYQPKGKAIDRPAPPPRKP